MDPDQDLGEPGRLRRSPAPLAADDLVAATRARSRLNLQLRRVAARLHRSEELLDQLDQDVDPGLTRG